MRIIDGKMATSFKRTEHYFEAACQMLLVSMEMGQAVAQLVEALR
jgi:hypothetical protein